MKRKHLVSKARQVLRTMGGAFADNFLKSQPHGIRLRSIDPAVCWKAHRSVNFLVVSEFSGPTTTDAVAPLLLRIRLNLYAPPALNFHLKSPAVRHRLGFGSTSEPCIAEKPFMEITASPQEVGALGSWVPTWFYANANNSSRPPQPPIPLLSWMTNDDLSDRFLDFTTLGRAWRKHGYLWTPHAVENWTTWLRK